MNYLAPQLVAVKKLKLPGDIKARMSQPDVVDLSISIDQRTGARPLHLPTVEYPSMELLSGRDRVAAQLLLGYRSIWVQPISQLTAKERRDIIRDENIHRRVDDRDALILQRVTERAAELEAERAELPPEPRGPHRPKTPKGEAREQIAAELGTTVEAVRKAEERAAAPEPELVDKCPLTRCVETWGLPLLTDAENERVRAAQAAIDSADSLLRRAQAELRDLETGPLAAIAPVLLQHAHVTAHAVRASRPVAVCPYCKRTNPACGACRGVGFVPDEVMLGVSDELKLGGKLAMVATPNGLVRYAKVKKESKPVDGDGEPVVPVPMNDDDDFTGGIPF